MPPILGCVADDYTGATDLGCMIARTGARVIQTFGVAAIESMAPTFSKHLAQADVIVVALKIRSIEAADAVSQARQAYQLLTQQGLNRFFYKYCSTFDSTSKGNIGPVVDALAESMGENSVIFCPAFPENGRTVYQGHLFVGHALLSESGMRNHPLTPMTDSNLVRVLEAQSCRTVGNLPLDATEFGHQQHLIADVVDNDDLRRVAAMAKNHRLLTGSSAIAHYWFQEIVGCEGRRAGGKQSSLDQSHVSDQAIQQGERVAILAGSCSDATRRQVSVFRQHHPSCDMRMEAVDSQAEAKRILGWCDAAWDNASSGKFRPLLVCSGAEPNRVEQLQRVLGASRAADHVEEVFARVAIGLRKRGIRKLIVAGGETSGAVINALGIQAIRIGPEIESGVPWVQTLDDSNLAIALKSGNFGGDNFFARALEIVE